jgi:hypothetical protein
MHRHNLTQRRAAIAGILGLLAIGTTLPALADPLAFSGTRSNVSLGGVPGGRCGSAILVSFSPSALSASGTSNLGAFSYTGSHCIASFPPGPYTDGQFIWTFGDGTLSGTYDGRLTSAATPASFLVSENIVFTGGTGRFLGASGTASATGTLGFGNQGGVPVSTGEVTFSGNLNLAPVPEPASAALLLGGLVAVVARGWRWRTAQT